MYATPTQKRAIIFSGVITGANGVFDRHARNFKQFYHTPSRAYRARSNEQRKDLCGCVCVFYFLIFAPPPMFSPKPGHPAYHPPPPPPKPPHTTRVHFPCFYAIYIYGTHIYCAMCTVYALAYMQSETHI